MKFLSLSLSLCLCFYLFVSLSIFAQSNDQSYDLPSVKPEIPWDQMDPIKDKDYSYIKMNHYYIALVRGDLSYHLDSINNVNDSQEYNPYFLGINVGQKFENSFLKGKGNFEMGFEWQKFNRKVNSNSQDIQIVQIHLLQNRDLWNWHQFIFFSAGVGIAPVYLAANQSIIGNSVSHFGAMILGPLNFSHPLKSGFDINLGLKSGYGRVGGTEIILPSIQVGINFEI